MAVTGRMRIAPVAYLASYLLSLLGNSIAGVALPLIVLQVTGSVLGAGVVAAATAVPAVLAGLFMGVVIDRIDRRTASVVTDLVSAGSIAALPIVDLTLGLDLGWFIVLGILGSLGDVPGMTAREALLPAVIRHSGVSAERMVGTREALGAVALILGPAAAGTLMVLFEGSTVLWITAATSAAAAVVTLLIPRRVGSVGAAARAEAAGTVSAGARAPGGWSMLRDGWRHLFRTPFLLVTTAMSLVSVFVLSALQGLVLPVYFTAEQRPEMLGFVLTALAVGMLVGGALFAAAGGRMPRRWCLLVGLAGNGLGFALIATVASTVTVFAGAAVVGLSSGLFGSLIGVLMIERIPEEMRGRVMGTQNALMTAAPALGIVVAAVLTEASGVAVAALVVVSPWIVVLGLGLFARSLRTLEPITGSESTGVVSRAQR